MRKRLSNDTVHKVCQSMLQGNDEKTICEEFNISKRIYDNIRLGYSYSDIVSQYGICEFKNSKPYKLTPQTIKRVQKLLNQNKTVNNIAKILNISEASVYRIKSNLKKENECIRNNSISKLRQLDRYLYTIKKYSKKSDEDKKLPQERVCELDDLSNKRPSNYEISEESEEEKIYDNETFYQEIDDLRQKIEEKYRRTNNQNVKKYLESYSKYLKQMKKDYKKYERLNTKMRCEINKDKYKNPSDIYGHWKI